MSTDDAVQHLSWYWGRRLRAEISQELANEEDGTFLLFRQMDSQDFTVALRVEGRTEYIEVLYRDGLYGFAEPLQFDDIEFLLEAYTESTTAIGQLLYAYDSPRESNSFKRHIMQEPQTNDIREWLIHLKHRTVMKTRLKEQYYEMSQHCRSIDERNNELKRQIEGLEMTDKMLENHLKQHQQTADLLQASISGQVAQRMSDNYEALQSKRAQIKNKIDEIESSITEQQNYRSQIIRQLSDKKTEIGDTEQSIDTIIRQLESLGLKDEFIDGYLNEEWDPHYTREAWLASGDSKLFVKPKEHEDGTFVVKQSNRSSKPYTIDVVFDNRVASFPVFKIDGRFGFDVTTCVFETLDELVTMYSKTPFRVHDGKYGTLTLKYPAGSVPRDSGIY